MCHQNDTSSVTALIEARGPADYIQITLRPHAAGISKGANKMQAVINTRPNPFRALLIVVLVGAALIIAMLGGYIAGSRPSNPSVTSTSVYPLRASWAKQAPSISVGNLPASGQSHAPLHGHFGGFQ